MGANGLTRLLGVTKFLVLLVALVGFTAVHRNSHYYSFSNPTRCHSISVEGRAGDLAVNDHAIPVPTTFVPPPALLAPRHDHAVLVFSPLRTIALVVTPQRRPPPSA